MFKRVFPAVYPIAQWPPFGAYVASLTAVASIASVACAPWVAHAATVPTPSAAVEIGLAAQVDVDNAEVTLGQIARIHTSDTSLQTQLATLPLGHVSSAGGPVTLRRDALQRWIVARTDLDAGQIAWRGADASRIRLATHTLPGQRIAQCASDALASWLSASGARVQLDVASAPQDLQVPGGELDLRARQRSAHAPDSALLARRMSVWVDVRVNGATVRTVPVDFNVNVRAPAYVATRELAAGSTLGGDALTVREVEWSGLAAVPVRPSGRAGHGSLDDNADTANVANAATAANAQPPGALRLRRPLSAGDTLSRGDVERAPLVARGEWATLSESQGTMQLESRVEVLEDGQAGQLVRVRLTNASSSIQARVVGPGKLEMPL